MSGKRQSSPGASTRKELQTEEESLNVKEVGEEGPEEIFLGQVDIDPKQSENMRIKATESFKRDKNHGMAADSLVPGNLLKDRRVIRAPKKGRIIRRVGFKRDQTMAGGLKSEEDSVQDQTIIAPEIMSLILEQLDLQGLKQVRRVCKSWLLQAQYHLQRRIIVRLNNDTIQYLCYAGIPKFASVCLKRIRALPLPFQSVDVNLKEVSAPPPEIILDHLSRLPPPLAVTRFSPGSVSLHLAIPLIIQCSSTLEYLQLCDNCFNKNHVSLTPMDYSQQLSFPKLRHLNVVAYVRKSANLFPSVVAWVAKNSPSLETYESVCENWSNDFAEELASQLCLQVDIKNVRNLTLSTYRLNTVAFNHFLTIPFTQLQCLNMSVRSEESQTEALAATVTKCANSLTTLDLSGFDWDIDDLKFPVCSNVRELSLLTLNESDGGILSYLFPALQVVNVHKIQIDLDRNDDWNSFFPLFELKTLRVIHVRQFYHGYQRREYESCMSGCSDDDYESPWENKLVWTEIESESSSSKQLVTFLQKFPALERLRIPSYNIIGVCKDIRDKKCCSSLLEGVKHLELCGLAYDCSPLAVLKGIETITMMPFNDSVPVAELPCLKLLQFPWDNYSNLNEFTLQAMARGVGRVTITNCCSFRRTGYTRSKEHLERFFESVSNAECGCKDGERIIEMMWGLGQDNGRMEEFFCDIWNL